MVITWVIMAEVLQAANTPPLLATYIVHGFG
jgi:drug/metabolite transporter (DMT)-like permease